MLTSPGPRPERIVLEGAYVTLRPVTAADAADLWRSGADDAELWQYMAGGPFASLEEFQAFVRLQEESEDPLHFAILDRESGRSIGTASLMRIEPKHRVIEVGHILFTGALQRTRGATEAMYLLARYVFEVLGYRRYEWKCNAANEKSKRAAGRLGFTFEGVFRQHMIIKGENRDTAWYSMLDSEWPEAKVRFERWLDKGNFMEDGSQRSAL